MNLAHKKVAVFGPGVSGKASLKFLELLDTQGPAEILVIGSGDAKLWGLKEQYTRSPYRIVPQDDPSCAEELACCDLILLAPGIARECAVLATAFERGVKVWCEVELAYQFNKNLPIVAVTGTNGKTTTVTLLGELFRAFGLRTFVGGNIGLPFVEACKEKYDIAILELSSFQLESLEDFHASVTAILNVFPNHGERYNDHEQYRLAKWNIIAHQNSDEFLYTGEGVGNVTISKGSPERVEISRDFEQQLLDEVSGFDFSKLKIVGLHNRKNIWFAWKLFSQALSDENGEKVAQVFRDTVYRFSGVEHRVEALEKWRSIEVYNDAKSTNWEATLTAVKAVEELKLPIILVMGGQLRGNNDLPKSCELEELKKSVDHCLVIGESGQVLAKNDEFFEDVKNIVGVKGYLEQRKVADSILLFSPGFPSFDQFKNYAHRGREFKKLFTED